MTAPAYAWVLVGYLCTAGHAPPNCDMMWVNPLPYQTPRECLEGGVRAVLAADPLEVLRCERRTG